MLQARSPSFRFRRFRKPHLHNNERSSRINLERQRVDANIDDVCGSENTVSEVAHAIEAGFNPDTGDYADQGNNDAEPDPEPELKRRRVNETNEVSSAAQASSSASGR